MTTQYHARNSGVRILLSSSKIGSSTLQIIEAKVENWDSYSHSISALGGYDSATISIPMQREKAEEYYQFALGYHVDVYNSNLVKVWEGFVDSIQVQMGTLTATRGPLIDVANKVRIIYSTIDTTTTPPTVGVRRKTAFSSDTASQSQYGILEKILSTGGATRANALQVRDTFLAEHKEPETSQQITIGSEASPQVTLNCLGYYYFLNYPYNVTTTGATNIGQRIQDIITADPNSIISTDFTNVSANATSIPAFDNDNRLAWDIIKELVSKGDASYNRYIFGLYNDRLAYYDNIPTSVEYYHRIADNKQLVQSVTGVEVKPWDVRPGKWMQISDWLIGQSPAPASDLRSDPRNLFIDRVQYTAPWGLSISGSKIETLPQILGQLGLSGVGA